MKKYIIYIVILVIGFLLGMLFFGDSSEKNSDHNHEKAAQKAQMWTCSMHPQIMQPESGDCPICGMDLIPSESGSDGLLADQFRLTENAMALANIQTTIVGKGMAEDNVVKLSGKISENEEANSVQVSYFSGRIEQLNVSFTGEEVRKGQMLATIYSPELYAAQQELITSASLKKSQPELYKAVRNKLKIWKLSENQINQIETSGKVNENVPVYANVSGTVTEKLVEQGDYIKQGQPLLKITNLNTVWGNFDVYENQIDHFKKGQEVIVTTSAYQNKEFKGKVAFIDPVLNTKTRTVTLRVVLNNQSDVFKPGMFVQAKIEGALVGKEDVLTIPSSAVLWTGERSVVYLKNNPDQPVFEMQEVVLGNQIGNEYQVMEGLIVGNEIVTNGTFTIDAAAQLQGKKSMMNKAGSSYNSAHKGHGHSENIEIKTQNTNAELHQRVEVSTKFKQQLGQVFDSYIDIKEALVADDASTVVMNSNVLMNRLSELDQKLLPGKPDIEHMNQVKKGMQLSADAMVRTTNIEEQRKYFKVLSTHLTNAVQMYGVGQKIYNQYCPMADDDMGAYWLSDNKNVLNPYFGSAMLSCGSVKQVIEE